MSLRERVTIRSGFEESEWGLEEGGCQCEREARYKGEVEDATGSPAGLCSCLGTLGCKVAEFC